ncbi:MAG TPA: DUF488 family protein [Terriglobales bacterium]|jgi:uncharacterized protein YeaO (DUF488 family)|nr:DUF488 family protein [Terriglobales bacterium]
MQVVLKRAHDKPAASDGTRVLVERLWPRGLSRKRATLDTWLREVAPSPELRRWFHARPAQWLMFRKRYLAELARPEASRQLEQLYSLAATSLKLTLVFASRDQRHNSAAVLKQLLEGMRKPPSTTGPKGAAARAVRARAARRRP